MRANEVVQLDPFGTAPDRQRVLEGALRQVGAVVAGEDVRGRPLAGWATRVAGCISIMFALVFSGRASSSSHLPRVNLGIIRGFKERGIVL